ncbi:MAG: N-acetylmuramoyl-L-alanine amidase [Terrisporobacter sp.]
MSKYNVHSGHGKQDSKSCGAYSNIMKESIEDRLVKDEVVKLLRENGHTVYDCTCDYPASQNDCINQIVKKSNTNKADLDISIHFNSGRNNINGDGKIGGCEVLIYDDSARKEAERVCKKLASLGFTNRGVKYNKNLGVLANTKAPALLVEVCFVDDKDDVDLYNKLGYKVVTKAIVEGMLNKNLDNKGEFDMNKIVLYFGDADLFTATIVSQKFKCPLMKKSDFDASGLKAKEIVQIGGKKEDTDRFTTMKNACKYL